MAIKPNVQTNYPAGLDTFDAGQYDPAMALAVNAIEIAVGTTGAPGAALPFQLISKQTLATQTAAVTFSAIPQTFNHLQLVAIARSSYGNEVDNWSIQFNGDTAGHYDEIGNRIYGGISHITVQTAGTGFGATLGDIPGSTGAPAGLPGRLKLDVPFYVPTIFSKVVGTEYGAPDQQSGASNGLLAHAEGVWRSTAAITAISLGLVNGQFLTGSTFCLYGIN